MTVNVHITAQDIINLAKIMKAEAIAMHLNPGAGEFGPEVRLHVARSVMNRAIDSQHSPETNQYWNTRTLTSVINSPGEFEPINRHGGNVNNLPAPNQQDIALAVAALQSFKDGSYNRAFPEMHNVAFFENEHTTHQRGTYSGKNQTLYVEQVKDLKGQIHEAHTHYGIGKYDAALHRHSKPIAEAHLDLSPDALALAAAVANNPAYAQTTGRMTMLADARSPGAPAAVQVAENVAPHPQTAPAPSAPAVHPPEVSEKTAAAPHHAFNGLGDLVKEIEVMREKHRNNVRLNDVAPSGEMVAPHAVNMSSSRTSSVART